VVWRSAAGRSSLESRRGTVARLSSATATSAGGIVYRYQDLIPQLVVGRRKRERDAHTWTLPKGTPNAGETLEETALREVCEETGLTVRIVSPLEAIKYTFVQRGTRIHKTVHYFMMEPTGGALEGHDHEFEEVRWISFDEAAGMLSFDTERSLVSLAATRLPERAG
jgi:8-oxo-dGTP pyrophosphatase MutT (NUDIX family)